MRRLKSSREELSMPKAGVPSASEAEAAVDAAGKGSKAWIFGAYTFLFLWGLAYLVLFFTDRLPI